MAAEKNLLQATPSNTDAKFFELGAMFLFFAAFEGYLNWLGTRIAPEVWKDERHFFRAAPFQGTLGKYRFLAKILHISDPDSSQGPFQTANDLLDLRNMVAHPKAEAGEKPAKFTEGDSRYPMKVNWKRKYPPMRHSAQKIISKNWLRNSIVKRSCFTPVMFMNRVLLGRYWECQ